MSDDIVTRLRDYACRGAVHATNDMASDAADEIERLRTALALAVGEMSTSGEYAYLSPETLLNKFMEEARRG